MLIEMFVNVNRKFLLIVDNVIVFQLSPDSRGLIDSRENFCSGSTVFNSILSVQYVCMYI